MADYQILRAELLTDPLARGYAGMTDQVAADSLNSADRNSWRVVSSAEVFEALDPSEFRGLTNSNEARVDRILGLGDGIKTDSTSQARAELVDVFGGGSITISNLQGIARDLVSRAREIGFTKAPVTAIDVLRARS